MPVLTPLPQPPTTADAESFDPRADTFVLALPTMVTEFNNAINQLGLNIVPTGATPGIFSNTATSLFENIASGYYAYTTTQAHGTSVFPVVNLRRSRGTSAAPTAVQTTDVLGAVTFVGRDSAGAYSTGANIGVYCNGTVSSGCVPCNMFFDTTPVGGVATRRMEITADGSVLVNQSSAGGVLSVRAGASIAAIAIDNPSGSEKLYLVTRSATGYSDVQSSGAGLRLVAPTNNCQFYATTGEIQGYTSGVLRLQIASTGYLTVNSLASIATTGNPANVYSDSNGTIYRNTSSLRYKEDVEDYAPTASIDALRPVTFYNKADKARALEAGKEPTRSVGFIAEEVDAAGLTEFVAYDDEGRPDAVHYATIVALLTHELQALRARVAALEAAA